MPSEDGLQGGCTNILMRLICLKFTQFNVIKEIKNIHGQYVDVIFMIMCIVQL